MLIRAILSACAMALLPTLALADPTGTFNVKGSNADSSNEYQGTVKVVRNGQTYVVVWEIGGKESIGTGIGAKFVGDRFEMGPASDEDTAISVGYVSKDNFGIAMYFQQPDGTWQGIWTYGGSEKVTSEDWTRQ